MVEMHRLHLVDMSVSSFIVRAERMPIIQYTAPVYLYKSFMIFRHPPPEAVPTALLTPFTPTLWLASVAVVALLVVALRIATRFEHVFGSPDVDSSWSAVSMFGIGVAALQGLTVNTTWASGRLLMLVTFIFAVFLDANYNGAIVSSLLTPAPRAIRSLSALAESSLAVGLEDLDYNTAYLRISKDPVVQRLRERKRPVALPIAEGVARVAKERFAFQAEAVSIYPLLTRALDEVGLCALQEVVFMPHSMTHGAVPRGSPLREVITRALRRIQESGVLQHEHLYWTPPKPPCSQMVGEDPQPVGAAELTPALALVLAGALASLAALCVERRMHTRRARAPAGAQNVHVQKSKTGASDFVGCADNFVRFSASHENVNEQIHNSFNF